MCPEAHSTKNPKSKIILTFSDFNRGTFQENTLYLKVFNWRAPNDLVRIIH